MGLNTARLAAIDIGSNAVRLLVAFATENGNQPGYKKLTFIRVPIRLGDDTFLKNRIGVKQANKLVATMHAFRKLMSAMEVTHFRACATSALREAVNGKGIVSRIRKETGIKVEIIEGLQEAELIFANHAETRIDPESTGLCVDVGGGSTEITLLSAGEMLGSASFRIGTVRLLKNKVDQEEWKEMKKWIKEVSKEYRIEYIIGSGGNINKLYKLSVKRFGNKPSGYFITENGLRELRKFLSGFTVEERIMKLDMNPDRADVIIPAANIFLMILHWSKCNRIFVPKIGLSDGIIHDLYEKHLA